MLAVESPTCSITCKVNTLMPADVINNILCDITLSHSLTSEQIERIVQQPVKLIKINCFTNFVDTDLSTYHICVVISSITQQGSNHSHKAQCVCVYISECACGKSITQQAKYIFISFMLYESEICVE